MRKKIFIGLLLLMSLILGIPFASSVVHAESSSTVILQSDDYKLDRDYLDFYAVGSKHFSYSNNGDSSNGKVLANAFDGNANTYFESKSENVNGFVNSIEVVFDRAVNLDRLIYGAEKGTTRGYPTTLEVYYKTTADWILINDYETSETTNFVLFNLGQTLSVKEIKLNFKVVSKKHRYTATAREIYFLQPENTCFEDYANLFTDYAETTLNSKYSSIESLNNFEKQVKENINFSGENEKLERAKSVAYGKIYFNGTNEFSTNSSAYNVIERYGDTASYARNTLQLTSFGTNRQVTGLLAYAGDTVTVYVSADVGDPLPKIRFSQAMGHWRSWLGGEQQLKLGKNTFVVPNFSHSDYTVSVPMGGSIYIVNPYTEEQQSSNVKVYIEGGYSYPIFKSGMDEKEYISNLQIYANKCNSDSNIIDITEIVSDHAIVTVNATRASEIFATYSPNTSVTKWSEFMDKLLIFAGIPQDESDPLFNEKNLYIRHNLRIAQPWTGAFMYAGGEHVGVLQGSQNVLIYGSGFGWGVAHELGHALDNSKRTIGETSNNMWAKYNEAMIEGVGTRGDFASSTSALTNDNTYNSQSFFNSNRYNYLVWWYLETWQEGYWGKLENCYRGINATLNNFYSEYPDVKSKVNAMTETERQVFYSSIITGVDLTYYFDRWGYTIRNKDTDPVFRENTVSEAYKEVRNIANASEYVNDQFSPKLWYQTNTAHKENFDSVYTSDTQVYIDSVTKTSSGYNIFIKNNEPNGHLGYEILEGSESSGYKVIGFSYSKAFVDTTEYPDGYIPTYKVVAVDKAFGESATSVAKSISINTEVVCKVGETGYTSLISAIKDAGSGDTIYLLKSFSSPSIIIDKEVIISIDESVTGDITISKIQSGNLFEVGSGGSLKISGNGDKYIVLNGNTFSQKGALIYTQGKIDVSYVKLINNQNTGNGGAIYMAVANRSITSCIENVIISNNIANIGSAFYSDRPESKVNIISSQITNNKSLSEGIIKNKGTLSLNDCVIQGNSTINGVVFNYDGGILNVTECEISNNTAQTGAGLYIDGLTTITDTTISNNIASQTAGGLYYSSNVKSRTMKLIGVTFDGNKANNLLSDMYISGISVELDNVETRGLSKIELYGGTLRIKNNCNLNSMFVINSGSDLTILGEMFQGVDTCMFDVINFVDKMIIMSAKDYNLEDTDISKLHSDNGLIFSKSQNTIIASHGKVILSITIGDNAQKVTYSYGEDVTLNFVVSGNKYIEKYVGEDGSEYLQGSNFVLTENTSLVAVVKNKMKVTFVDSSTTHSEYYIPYSIINLPNWSSKDTILKAWICEDLSYFAGQDYVVTDNVEFVAKYEKLLQFIIKDSKNKVLYEKYVEYGEVVDISTLSLGEYTYLFNGEKVSGNVRITNDTMLVATTNGFDYKIVLVAGLLVLALIIGLVGISVYVRKKAKTK